MAYSLTYTYNSTSQSYSVTGSSNIATGDKVVIPATYNDGTNGEHPVTSIDSQAFYNRSKLTSVAISNGVTNIGSNAFAFCTNLASIDIPDSVTSIGTSAFNSCSKLTSVVIPDAVTSINALTFSNCSKLASIKMPSEVTSIGNSAFDSCYSLTSIIIPENVTSIGEYAFYSCRSLTNIILDNVTSIGTGAFSDCTKLTQIILFPSTPPTLGSGAIPSTIQSIYVQLSSKITYQIATNWNTFAGKIVSDNIYLSFVRFNQKNKEYINEKFDYLNNNTGAFLEFSIDNSTFVLTATLKNANGDVLGTPQTVDLPIESVVVNGTYNNDSKTIILTLQNGNTINIPVVDLVDGLSTVTNLENGTGDVLVQTTDSNQSFKVMTDGRAKVQSAPVDNDDVVRLSEVNPILSDYIDDALLGG